MAAKKTTTAAKKAPAAAAKKAPAAAAKKTAAAPKRKPSAQFMKAMTPSAELAAIIGAKPVPRTEVVKKIWEYIKKNNLQDAKNKRQINADDKLKAIFGGKKSVNMFEMTALVNKNLSAAD
ncbi:SWIB/MDM2 domain-containing protein [[Archangium] primigenium]|uniref:SWIB/MDM2 domain-containing protein n=1 Tax=Melittangium TaxID=44 RepID=UPI0019569BE8|nr:SWIB/MDM2 domain-containing protein [Archangium primigenium]MBM7118430.1 SWIB/MDM2 domain-containing protein [Archangium primigenium]